MLIFITKSSVVVHSFTKYMYVYAYMYIYTYIYLNACTACLCAKKLMLMLQHTRSIADIKLSSNISDSQSLLPNLHFVQMLLIRPVLPSTAE